MIRLYCLRHGPTVWNGEKRLQGREDIPLSDRALRDYPQWQLPPEAAQAHWYCSPLARAQQTAQALGLSTQISEALIEMHWGDWSGQRLSDLRQREGEAMRANEALGLDLRPPGGERPREVLARVRRWLVQLGPPSDIGLMCHKGVIRALLAEATGWDMRGKAPYKVDWRCLQVLGWQAGQLSLVSENLPLIEKRP